MRDQSKGTAACWDCLLYCAILDAGADSVANMNATIFSHPACAKTGTPVRLAQMPMKCKDKRKA
jgi:hypothetical protein